MAMKELVRKFQPIQLYIILILTTAFFAAELVVSHVTHSITLLIDSYQMLCNILAMAGCIITVKYGTSSESSKISNPQESAVSSLTSICPAQELLSTTTKDDKQPSKSIPTSNSKSKENKLKNTFGWARTDVIAMLTCCIFQASLSFSVLIEAIQTIFHIGHTDAIHQPLAVLCLGAAGLVLNGICYLLIGGYTFHQGSFLYITKSGDVVLNRIVVGDLMVREGSRRLSRTRKIPSSSPAIEKERQGFMEMCRDVIGSIFVIICALLVYFTEPNIAKYIDPVLSICSSGVLMFLSYPYMKESCLILLQTIPASIDIDSLKIDLIKHFPDIVNVHDFHVWQLTAAKVISTVHVIFKNKKGYGKIMDDIKDFFIENGITHVTIQPEFYIDTTKPQISTSNNINNNYCLMKCQGEGCKINHCCPTYEQEEEDPKLLEKFKPNSKELLPRCSIPDVKSIKLIVNNDNNDENV